MQLHGVLVQRQLQDRCCKYEHMANEVDLLHRMPVDTCG